MSLPSHLVRAAKIYAAEHDTTINGFVRDLLTEALLRQSKARTAGERLLALSEGGPYFTGDPRAIRREELHER